MVAGESGWIKTIRRLCIVVYRIVWYRGKSRREIAPWGCQTDERKWRNIWWRSERLIELGRWSGINKNKRLDGEYALLQQHQRHQHRTVHQTQQLQYSQEPWQLQQPVRHWNDIGWTRLSKKGLVLLTWAKFETKTRRCVRDNRSCFNSSQLYKPYPTTYRSSTSTHARVWSSTLRRDVFKGHWSGRTANVTPEDKQGDTL